MRTNDSMDDFRDEEREEKIPPKKHTLRHLAAFTVILIAVLAVAVAAAYRDGTGFDALRRYLIYGSTEKSGGTVSYTYDAAADNRFAVVDDRLAVLSGRQLQVLSGEGTVWSADVAMTTPALTSGGGCAAAVDVGGTELYVVDKNGLRLSLTAGAGEPFIAAELNAKGWLAVTSEKKGYKGCVSVYNDQMELAFTFNSSERFVTDARVSDDCKHLAAVTLGQKDSVFLSSLVLYDLSSTDPAGSFDVSGGLVLRTGEIGGRLAAVADTCLAFADPDGENQAVYDYGGAYLRECDPGGDDFAALLLNRYSSGSVGRIVTVDGNGRELGTLDVNEEVLSLSASGRYLAVLYADRVVIYNREMLEYATLKSTDYAKTVLMRTDGSALLIAPEKASLFLP